MVLAEYQYWFRLAFCFVIDAVDIMETKKEERDMSVGHVRDGTMAWRGQAA